VPGQIVGFCMGNFFAELKRRHIYRVAATYAVVAWLLLQIVNNVVPIMQSPVWVGQFCLLLLALGFPVAIFFAWMRELPPSDAAAPMRATFTDWALIGILAAVLAAVGYQQLAPSRATVTAASSSVEPARDAAAKPAGVFIAVLPFENLSGDAAQEFFSDGMTEEITGALAKVPDLKVVARTSAFQFRAQNRDIQSIGQQLHATHFIEGSVRKAGNRVRITAQLIKADDGTHIWAENYDRDLTDVFAVQEEIAQAIAGALRVPLGLKQGEALVPARTADVESYQQYLRARALVRARGKSILQAIGILEPLVARTPEFAPAWALIAHAYFLLPTYDPVVRTGTTDEVRHLIRSYFDKAEGAARRAIQLDSKNASGFGALAGVQMQTGKWAEAEELFRQALALDPLEPDTLYNLSITLASTGRFKDALAVGEKLQALEPFVPNYNLTVAAHILISGRIEAAISILEAIPPDAAGGYFRAITLAQAYAAVGRFGDAATALLAMPQPNVVGRQSVEDAAQLIRMAPAKVQSTQELPNLDLSGLNFVYGYIGVEDRVMEFAEHVRLTTGGTTTFIWTPAYALARKTERFKAHLRAVGLADYWRAKGWPSVCHPTSGDDFECD
jgi:TolB-like protein